MTSVSILGLIVSAVFAVGIPLVIVFIVFKLVKRNRGWENKYTGLR